MRSRTKILRGNVDGCGCVLLWPFAHCLRAKRLVAFVCLSRAFGAGFVVCCSSFGLCWSHLWRLVAYTREVSRVRSRFACRAVASERIHSSLHIWMQICWRIYASLECERPALWHCVRKFRKYDRRTMAMAWLMCENAEGPPPCGDAAQGMCAWCKVP